MNEISFGVIKKQLKLVKEKGAFYVFIGNFANKFVTLCGSIFVVRILTKGEYGTLSYLENLYSYIYIFSGLGLAAAVLRYVVIAEPVEKKKGYYEYVLRRQTLYNIGIVIIVAIINIFYPHPSEYINATWLFLILILDIPFNDIANSNLCVERAMFATRRYAVLSLIFVAVSVVFRIIGSYYFGLDGNIVFRVLADILCAVLLCIIVTRRYFRKTQIPEAIALSKDEKRQLNRYAFQNMMANGFWVLYLATDMFLLGRLMNNADVLADYKVAILIANNVIIISNAIVVFIGPYFVKNENDHHWVMKNYKKVIIINALLLGTLVLFLIIFARPIILILYGENYLNVVPLMRVLLCASFLNGSFRAMNSSLLATMGQSRINMMISCVGFITQVIACLMIIPQYGIMGLAIENVIMYLLLSIAFTLAFVKRYRVKQ